MAKTPAPRPIWTGSISFGLVNIPVRLVPAVREESVRFHLLHDQDHARLRRKMVCSADGKEVHPEHTVKGYEVGPDQYVIIRQEELEAVAPRRTRTIDIEDFVGLDEIDPVYFDRTYYVTPQEAGAKAYALLVEAMAKSHKIGVARFVMHNKEYLVALRPRDGVLCMETMHFSDEVMPTEALGPAPARAKGDDREIRMAQQLIDSLSTRFKPDKYQEQYRQAIRDMVERKAAGEQIVTAPQPKEEPGRVGNLLEALEASVEKARGGKGERTPKGEHPGQTKRRRKSK